MRAANGQDTADQAPDGARFTVAEVLLERDTPAAFGVESYAPVPAFEVVDTLTGFRYGTVSSADVAVGLPLEARHRIAGARARARAAELTLEVGSRLMPRRQLRPPA